jgi:tetratricopeptide (TPR) repeat protein
MRMVQQFISSAAGEMDIDELNNAINAKFSGRLPDSDELPRNTPSERAEALYQEALENFGRRRVLLAREALAEDPNHAEASILIAELTRAPDVRIEMFGNAKAASAKTLGKKMKEFSGDFWLIPETRPYMRACQGLAESFADAGQINEAIEQYAELLERNPEDNQGARYAIVPLLLAQDRNDEALAVLDSYQEESAIWLYLKAFAKFRSGENSVKSRQAIRKAFQANEHVVPMLIMDEPVMLPADYELGSPEEAAICLHDFDDLWHEDEEFTLWMLQEYRGWDREREKKRRDRQRKLKQNRPKRK